MKVFWKLTVALAIAACLGGSPGLIRETLAANITISDDAAPVPPMPTPKPAPAKAAPEAPKAVEPAAEEPKKEEEEKKDECKAWELFGTTCSGIHVGGWIEGGVTYNEYGRQNQWNGPLVFNDRNEGVADQVMLFAEKAVKTDSCCWTYGGRIEVMFGRDSLFIQSLGLELHDSGERHWNGNRFYGLSVPQAYVEAANDKYDIKAGKMVTPLEYEVISATGNFFYSHSYGFAYAVPFTQTGVMGTAKIDDCWTVLGGAVNGWDRTDGERDEVNAVVGFVNTPCHKKYTTTFNLITGKELTQYGEYTNRTAYSLVFNYTVNECWTYVFVHDLGFQDRAVNTSRVAFAPEQAQWYGANTYLIRNINDCWKFAIRAEWFRDEDGVRVTGAGLSAGDSVYQGGSPGDFYEVTLGANYTPHANVWIRPEVRYDWYNGSGTQPFNNNTKVDQLSLALDAIFTF